MQTGTSETLIGWKSGKTTYFPLWDRMEGAWLWTLRNSLYWGTPIDNDDHMAYALYILILFEWGGESSINHVRF
jgi:hypothetical protein